MFFLKYLIHRQYLQTHGFNVKHTTVQNGSLCTETLLSQTVRMNQKDLLLYLLDHGADVNYMYMKEWFFYSKLDWFIYIYPFSYLKTNWSHLVSLHQLHISHIVIQMENLFFTSLLGKDIVKSSWFFSPFSGDSLFSFLDTPISCMSIRREKMLPK